LQGAQIDFETAFSAIAALDIVNGGSEQTNVTLTILSIGRLLLSTHSKVPQAIDYERAYYL